MSPQGAPGDLCPGLFMTTEHLTGHQKKKG